MSVIRKLTVGKMVVLVIVMTPIYFVGYLFGLIWRSFVTGAYAGWDAFTE